MSRKQIAREHDVKVLTVRPRHGPVEHQAVCRTCSYKGSRHFRKAEAALDKITHIGKHLRIRR